jgi:hypothetical protein
MSSLEVIEKKLAELEKITPESLAQIHEANLKSIKHSYLNGVGAESIRNLTMVENLKASFELALHLKISQEEELPPEERFFTKEPSGASPFEQLVKVDFVSHLEFAKNTNPEFLEALQPTDLFIQLATNAMFEQQFLVSWAQEIGLLEQIQHTPVNVTRQDLKNTWLYIVAMQCIGRKIRPLDPRQTQPDGVLFH